ncbi:class I SAM-dependent methyltransferase [Phaeobacter sp.]|uniref:class I SAM-dependent methyltransferase n=1 Tax=Phaeobacter sp. TaxID=1902409 RepID=UPI0025E5A8CC|nr:class I SAM-dependent methyltransferase [Phaeobacter sp.]
MTMSGAQCDLFNVSFEPSKGFLTQYTEDQKFWIIQRAISDFAEHLVVLHGQNPAAHSQRAPLVGALHDASPSLDDTELLIAQQEVMQSWETPLMHHMARKIAGPGASVLEIGFGMGISAAEMLRLGATSYTVVEANPEVVDRARAWGANYPDVCVTVIEGRWQDQCALLVDPFDGIFFDTYPESEKDWYDNALRKSCYAENFFDTARRLLHPEGTFTYYTGETDHLGRRHQRKLFEHFSRFDTEICDGLNPPESCSYWWDTTMVVVGAQAPR